MAGRLQGKRALLTASAAGIGRATAEAFIAEGAEVIATDIDLTALKGLACETRRLDVRSSEAVNAMAREIGAVDLLFNCAGFVHHGSVLECSDEDWDFSFDLNVKSMHRTIKAFAPGTLPFPLLHVDTTWKFREMIAFRDETVARLGLDLLVHINQEGVAGG